MGLSLSLLASACQHIVKHTLYLAYNKITSTQTTASLTKTSQNAITRRSLKSSSYRPENIVLDRNLSFTSLVQVREEDYPKKNEQIEHDKKFSFTMPPALRVPEPVVFFSPRPTSELDAAAIKLQKVYKSYRTRRNLADCAVVVEELWWKALDFAALKRSSVSFFNDEKPETAVSRWARARTRAAKVGKGLSKHEKAQKLALQHWLEAIDPRHRYGHNLRLYYDIWFESESVQPFFYWLDVGDGKEVNIEKCPRSVLQRQCIKYLGPKEREAYEVIVEKGKLVYKQSGELVGTKEGSKWIFVLSTTTRLYVGEKIKGVFQHSSFLSGAATTAAGRLVAHDGLLQAIWPYSGHYHPTHENFMEFISFLNHNHVDLSNVKRYAIDDDSNKEDRIGGLEMDPPLGGELDCSKRLACKWSTGTGPRIGCVRDYPVELQSKALEQVNLSPRLTQGPPCPIPSPRPSPKFRMSPRLSYIGLPSPPNSIPAQ